MNTEFRVRAHHVREDVQVVEIWFAGKLVATLSPAGGSAGINVISRFPMTIEVEGNELLITRVRMQEAA